MAFNFCLHALQNAEVSVFMAEVIASFSPASRAKLESWVVVLFFLDLLFCFVFCV